MVNCRLQTELESLHSPEAKTCGLVVDEMRIQQKLEYHRQRDAFIGEGDFSSELQHLVP